MLQAPLIEHADAVAYGESLVLVVRDQQRGRAVAAQDVAQFLRQTVAQAGIEVGEGLVQQQQLRTWCQGARQRHPLLLATGKLVRITSLQPSQTDQLQHLGDAFLALALGQGLQTEGHIAADIEMGEQGVILKHHAHAALLGRHGIARTADDFTRQRDAASRYGFQPGHRAQQRGLATAGRAEQHANLPGRQRQADILNRRGSLSGVVHAEGIDGQLHGAKGQNQKRSQGIID